MRNKQLILSAVVLFVCGLSTLQAQESVNSAGGNASGDGGSAGYTIGQFAYQTNIGITGSLTEGVQQPYEISVVTAIEEAKGLNISIIAYPNPTIDHFILEVNDIELTSLRFQLYDMNGKQLENKRITSNKTSIVISNLAPATYFVKVIRGYSEVKVFKIIKAK